MPPRPSTSAWKAQQAERAAEEERIRAAEIARKRAREGELLRELWSIQFKIIDITQATGDSDDDEQQVEARRLEQLRGLRSRWLRATSELRGARWDTPRQDIEDEPLPDALRDVGDLEDDDGLSALLDPPPRRSPKAGWSLAGDALKRFEREVVRTRHLVL